MKKVKTGYKLVSDKYSHLSDYMTGKAGEEELDISLCAVDRLLYRKIQNNIKGIYFDELTFDRCLKIVNDGDMKNERVLPLYKKMAGEGRIFITAN